MVGCEVSRLALATLFLASGKIAFSEERTVDGWITLKLVAAPKGCFKRWVLRVRTHCSDCLGVRVG